MILVNQKHTVRQVQLTFQTNDSHEPFLINESEEYSMASTFWLLMILLSE